MNNQHREVAEKIVENILQTVEAAGRFERGKLMFSSVVDKDGSVRSVSMMLYEYVERELKSLSLNP
jgi:hypothetical protein